jgi:putative ABC transport system ATP-binding protein
LRSVANPAEDRRELRSNGGNRGAIGGNCGAMAGSGASPTGASPIPEGSAGIAEQRRKAERRQSHTVGGGCRVGAPCSTPGVAAPSILLTIRQLCRAYREGDRTHRVLDGANAQIRDGETVAILGRSGSGKSTLLNVISGIDRPDSGSVEVDGQDISRLAEPARTLFRRARIGFVYQFFNLIPTLDVEENVRLVLELNGVRGREARRRSEVILQQVGLADRSHSSIDTLSGGEQQRVAIARALVHEPSLLLADEPTGNLDEQTSREVMPLLLSLGRSKGTSLLLVTHDTGLARDSDRVLELRDGRLQPPGA